jgi:hypothetical protein
MGLQNRDKGINEQVDNWDTQTAVVGVSALIQLTNIPYSGQLLKVTTSAFGLSGSPIVGLQIQRFIVGAGLTTIPINGSSLMTVSAFSTSGLLTHSIPAPGSTLVQLQAGDQLQIVTSVASSAATYATNAVVQCLQDFKTQYGLFAGN